ncbi:hypothetical protein JCM16303_003061 [Sporobolomyces ruberrimus]
MGLPIAQNTVLSHPALGGAFEVYVEINGKRAPVHGAAIIGNKVQGYVEAIEGANFSVHVCDGRTHLDYGYSGRLHIDGAQCDSVFLGRDDLRFRAPQGSPSRTYGFKGQRDSETSEKPFMFGRLQTTDDDDAANNNENFIRNLGSIKFTYHRGEALQRHPAARQSYDDSSLGKGGAVHEKTKKGNLSHRASLGASVAAKRQGGTVSVHSYDPVDAPFCSFEFSYRSRQLLQLEGHMPDDAPLFMEPLAQITNQASGSGSNGNEVGTDGLTRKQRIAKMRADLAADSSDDEALRVDVKPKRPKLEVKAEKDQKPKKREILVLSDSD